MWQWPLLANNVCDALPQFVTIYVITNWFEPISHKDCGGEIQQRIKQIIRQKRNLRVAGGSDSSPAGCCRIDRAQSPAPIYLIVILQEQTSWMLRWWRCLFWWRWPLRMRPFLLQSEQYGYVNAAPFINSRPFFSPFWACSSFGMGALLDAAAFKYGNIVLYPSILSSPAINSWSFNHFNALIETTRSRF